jgi:hypothetical protein
VALGPAQIHAQKHRGPVRGFGPTGSRADRQEGVSGVVLAAEKQVSAGLGVLRVELRRFALDFRQQAVIVLFLGKIEQLGRRLSQGFEVSPKRQLFAQAFGLAEDLLGGALILPEPGFAYVRLEFGEAFFFGLEVKDAPRSPESGLPDRGFLPAPLGAASHVLE